MKYFIEIFSSFLVLIYRKTFLARQTREDLVNSLMEINKQLKFQSLHDDLTKLPNRFALESALERDLLEAQCRQQRLALIFIDLDGFKAINDSLGHQSGDLLLIDVAQRIKANIRERDIAARLGGDEFAILIDAESSQAVLELAQRILKVLQNPFVAGKHMLGVSASMGIALYPDDATSSSKLLVNADIAMYHAKNHGRNCYCFFSSNMSVDIDSNFQLTQDIRVALERGQFSLLFQPKISAKNGRILGAEALLRWVHPQRGMVEPTAFVYQLEKNGLIIPVGEWIIDEVCRQLQEWSCQGLAHLKIGVNISAIQLHNDTLIGHVECSLRRHNVPAHRLVLEVTESAAMNNIDENIKILNALAALGVEISIDDFGSGYSSLLYLKRFPASELKIDKEFIRDPIHGSRDAAIVTAIVELGKILEMCVVAEGIETAAQKELALASGCDVLQGYFFGAPMSAKEFSRCIDKENKYVVIG